MRELSFWVKLLLVHAAAPAVHMVSVWVLGYNFKQAPKQRYSLRIVFCRYLARPQPCWVLAVSAQLPPCVTLDATGPCSSWPALCTSGYVLLTGVLGEE